MNFKEASDFIFDNAEELIRGNKLLIAINHISTSTKKRSCSLLILNPVRHNGGFAYRMMPAPKLRMIDTVHFRSAKTYTVPENQKDYVASIQDVRVANLNFIVMPAQRINGCKADSIIKLIQAQLMVDQLKEHQPIQPSAGNSTLEKTVPVD